MGGAGGGGFHTNRFQLTCHNSSHHIEIIIPPPPPCMHHHSAARMPSRLWSQSEKVAGLPFRKRRSFGLLAWQESNRGKGRWRQDNHKKVKWCGEGERFVLVATRV